MQLKNKKHNSQIDWLNGYGNIKEFAKTEQGKRKAEKLIQTAINRLPNGKCVYGWSGGKDAIALQCICEIANIRDCVLGTIGDQWEYPSFLEFVSKNAPANLTIKNFNVTADFLNANPDMVFPNNSKELYKWYVKCNQNAYYQFAKEKNADYIILGHRILDGNVCKNGYMKQKVFPIYDFTHEDIFLLISYFNKSLPEQYFYPRGFYEGTQAFIMRSGGTKAMHELYGIDKNILLKHTEINKIKNFLMENKYL